MSELVPGRMNFVPDADACRLCGATKVRETLVVPPHRLLRCAGCGLVSLHPLPSPEQLARCYNKQYWGTSAQGIGRIMYDLRMRPVAAWLRRNLPAGARILDIGSGDGKWMRLAERFGFEAWGVDQYAHGSDHPRFIAGDLDSAAFPDESFACVTFFHVLEHLENPRAAFEQALRLLVPGGLLLLEAPNGDSWGLRVFGCRWQPLEVPTHFNFFTPNSLTWLGQACGARLETLHFFSLRASAAALALSLVPELSPRVQRRRGTGGLTPNLAFLALQTLTLPFALGAAAAKKGCIIQAIYRK